MSDTAAPAAESKTSTDEQSFLSRLVDFGDEIIAAERPAIADVPKVLGALIHWVDQGGGYVTPESFNPALSEAVAEQEAEQSRLAAANADMAKRLESLETLMRQQIAAAGTVSAAPVTPAPGESFAEAATGADTPSPVTPSEGAVPAVPAPAPAVDVVPGVTATPTETVTAPAEAAAPPVAAPVPPVVSE